MHSYTHHPHPATTLKRLHACILSSGVRVGSVNQCSKTSQCYTAWCSSWVRAETRASYAISASTSSRLSTNCEGRSNLRYVYGCAYETHATLSGVITRLISPCVSCVRSIHSWVFRSWRSLCLLLLFTTHTSMIRAYVVAPRVALVLVAFVCSLSLASFLHTKA